MRLGQVATVSLALLIAYAQAEDPEPTTTSNLEQMPQVGPPKNSYTKELIGGIGNLFPATATATATDAAIAAQTGTATAQKAAGTVAGSTTTKSAGMTNAGGLGGVSFLALVAITVM
ncbi:hypothetical protein BCR33DRAFT_720701 [Rhizoclosmatium globosum]|uniref:Uncharacterized protein n=1 Tax=Rhizoclosmatium globosum TaxID=329046 RepID=A0A1Y2BUB9_9FUNG|nr:hypothetical protein BCR33DRAFT_720701 [Rhizoclosmatium globosum]|eukprot:ORY38333.1 hypothetical protein BCR33DRAFT_720701 [Rhizoclosmatium globosum]